MKCIARIKEASDDRARRVDISGLRALEWAYARAWNIERGDGAVASPHIAMYNIRDSSENGRFFSERC